MKDPASSQPRPKSTSSKTSRFKKVGASTKQNPERNGGIMKQRTVGSLIPTLHHEKWPTPPVWVYGINDHLDVPTELPEELECTGCLGADFRQLCSLVNAAVHPAFRQKSLGVGGTSRDKQ
eukprot:g23746.t1